MRVYETMISRMPAYNLKAVLRDTGLKADVLRAWERRYDLPTPQRTPGGHRLYSEYDIETIKWLRARQKDGLSISRAVELWKEMLAAGIDPLANSTPVGMPAVTPRFSNGEASLQLLRQNWIESNLAFDSSRADEVLNQAFALYPIETVCTEILQQGISQIGHYWHTNQASVQQEHFATAEARRRVETLITATPPPTRQQNILIGCPPGEQHTFSLLLLDLFLRRRGLQVIFLGADIPILQLADTAQMIHPTLIVLAAQQLSSAASLQKALAALQGLGVPLAYGGLIFNRLPALRQRMPAVFLGETLEAAVQTIEQLVIDPTALPQPDTREMAHSQLAVSFGEKRYMIEFDIHEILPENTVRNEFIDVANTFFGNALSAALELGDPAYIEADLEWLKRLLESRWLQPKVLNPYLSAYREAIEKELGDAGRPASDWIERYLAKSRNSHFA